MLRRVATFLVSAFGRWQGTGFGYSDFISNEHERQRTSDVVAIMLRPPLRYNIDCV